MAKNRKSDARKKIRVEYMDPKTGIVKVVVGNPQVVMSEKSRTLVEKYLSPKGKRLLAEKAISKKEAWARYGKNRYRVNEKAKPVKVIAHN